MEWKRHIIIHPRFLLHVIQIPKGAAPLVSANHTSALRMSSIHIPMHNSHANDIIRFYQNLKPQTNKKWGPSHPHNSHFTTLAWILTSPLYLHTNIYPLKSKFNLNFNSKEIVSIRGPMTCHPTTQIF